LEDDLEENNKFTINTFFRKNVYDGSCKTIITEAALDQLKNNPPSFPNHKDTG